MTFKDISFKIFKGNIQRYLSYFLCNSFLVMIFFMYSTLKFNDQFDRSSELQKGIGTAVTIANVALVVFSVFFVNYAHTTFIKARKKEFGLFMSLGMSINDIKQIIIFENSLVGLASIVTGILSGTIFSRLFFLLIMHLIDAKGVTFQIGYKNYLFSILIFAVIYLVAVFLTILTTGGFEIIDFIKGTRASDCNRISHPALGAIGVMIFVGALVYLYIEFNKKPEKDGELLLFCTVLCISGIYIMISQFGSYLLKLSKKHQKLYYSRILLITSIDYKFRQIKKIILIIVLLVMVTTFYSGHCLRLMLTAERIAEETNPYDITFVQTKDKNNLTLERLNSIIKVKDNPITKQIELEFVNFYDDKNDNERTTMISSKDLNQMGLYQHQVSQGQYLRAISYGWAKTADELDHFKEVNFKSSEISFDLVDGSMTLNATGDLFLRQLDCLNYFWGRVIVVNDDDYQSMKARSKSVEVNHVILLEYKDWKNTENVVNALSSSFERYNATTSPNSINRREEHSFEVAAKIKTYLQNEQGAGLAFYLVTFIGIFFFIASCITLFLKLLSDLDHDKDQYRKLYKLGITEKEIRRSIKEEMRLLFFIAPMMGIVVALAYTSIIYKNSDLLFDAYRSDLIIGAIYLCFQIGYYIVCNRKYGNQIMESLR